MGPGTTLLDGVERPRRGLCDVLCSRRLALLAFAAACIVPQALRPPTAPAPAASPKSAAAVEIRFEPQPGLAGDLDVPIPDVAPPEADRAARMDWEPDVTDPVFRWESASLDRIRSPLRELEPHRRPFAERRRAAERGR